MTTVIVNIFYEFANLRNNPLMLPYCLHLGKNIHRSVGRISSHLNDIDDSDTCNYCVKIIYLHISTMIY